VISPTEPPGSGTFGRVLRRVLPLVVVAALCLGATALGQGEDPFAQPEPDVTSGDMFRMPADLCQAGERVTVRIVPPSGAVLGSMRLHVRGREVVRLTGVARAASVTVRVPFAGGRVTATGETLGGQALRVSRVYRDCPPPPPPESAAPVTGGED
jgi:hypothetical protein